MKVLWALSSVLLSWPRSSAGRSGDREAEAVSTRLQLMRREEVLSPLDIPHMPSL